VDEAFASALNTVAQGLAFYDLHGTLVYRNRWLHQAVARPNGPALAEALADFVEDTRKQVAGRGIVRDTQVTRIQTKEMDSALHPVHALSASLVAYDLFGMGPSILVVVDAAPLRLPPPDDVRKRFGLTRAETRIAYHLAEGMRLDEIASLLCLPPHIVERHSERVLDKLGAPTRSDVAHALTD
jgi:DNA-binding CsgD family transcriptional regulator